MPQRLSFGEHVSVWPKRSQATRLRNAGPCFQSAELLPFFPERDALAKKEIPAVYPSVAVIEPARPKLPGLPQTRVEEFCGP
jgi:hypothetical protein